MAITAIKGPRNQELAEATCDECGATATVPASHAHHKGFARGGAPVIALNNPEQSLSKLRRQGWALVKNRLYCPDCEAARRLRETPTEKETMAAKIENVTQLRQPTIEQRRQIVEMLVITYDGAAQRYKGTDTDKTISDALGNGVMPGWVAEIREQNFGPAGGNEEIDAIRAALDEMQKRHAKEIVEMSNKQIAESATLRKRIDAVCAAVGPKAARV